LIPEKIFLVAYIGWFPHNTNLEKNEIGFKIKMKNPSFVQRRRKIET
jgi:hypothetical protein